MQDNNGFTQKELILMVLDNQKELSSKIEQLHSRMNERPTRMKGV